MKQKLKCLGQIHTRSAQELTSLLQLTLADRCYAIERHQSFIGRLREYKSNFYAGTGHELIRVNIVHENDTEKPSGQEFGQSLAQ